MASLPVLTEVNLSNLESLRCCGIQNPENPGRRAKNLWIRQQLKKGLRAKVLITPDHRQCGYIEALPGEYAWRGVEAKGYLVLHCVWIHMRRYQHKGWAATMVQSCEEDARKAGMHGVAVIARESPWLAGAALFEKLGFQTVDAAPPDYLLLAKKFERDAPNPSFRRGWGERLAKYRRGLTIIRSNQCPYAVRFAEDIAASAREDYGIEPRIVELESCRDAQNAPTPYAVFAVIYNGRLLADHQISRTRFRNIMRKVLP